MTVPGTMNRAANGAVAGLAGGIAFAVTMFADMAISRRRVNDFQMLAGFGPLEKTWRVTGPLIHMAASASMGAIYALCEPRLRGPGWLRGVTFGLTENALLWPAVVLVDRFHPAIRRGDLPSFNRPWPFIAENFRHVAYGLVLGLVFERIARRTR
jgi:hypothetical protein